MPVQETYIIIVANHRFDDNLEKMQKKLIPMDGGKAVIIDLPLLAIIGAEDAKALELTTDGERLILAKVRGTAWVSSPRSTSSGISFDRDDPKAAAKLIAELQKHGFTPVHFRRLHHFGPRASLESFLKYCKGTTRFTAETNRIVSDRLNACLEQAAAGMTLEDAISAAQVAHPFE